LIFKVFLGMISMVYVGEPWSFSGGYSCSMGEMLFKVREAYIYGCIICGSVEGEEEDMKSLILSSFVLSLMAMY